MGDITKGQTFVDGGTVDAAGLHALVESATINATFVSGKTAESTPVSADAFLLHDDSAATLKKVTYGTLATALSASLTLANTKEAIALTSHGFAVGDVIERTAASYAKAKAAADSHTFATGDVNTTTNRITITGHSLTNGEAVLLKSGTTLPAPLVAGNRYYAKKIDSNTLEIYSDSGLSSIVDLTDTGTGTHTIFYNIYKVAQLGVVSAVADANNFTVTYGGKVTGLSGLTDAAIYYLSASSAGATSTSIPSGVGEFAIPVMQATSTTTAVVLCAIAPQVAEDSIRAEHIVDKQIALAHLSATLQAQVQRNPSSQRQTVVAGSVDSNGQPDFLGAGSGLQVALSASTSEPVIISFANGSDGTNGYNYLESISSAQTFDSLTASSELFLYVDRATSGTLTYGFSKCPPLYGYARTVYSDRSVVPVFSSATLDLNGASHGITVTASSESGASNAGWHVFDNEYTTTNEWRTNSTTGACTLIIELPQPKVVNRFGIMCHTSNNGPQNFTWEGSNTGAFAGEETVLKTKTGATWTNGVFTIETTDVGSGVPNTTAYKYYRLNVTATVGGLVNTRISSITFLEACDHYYSIPEGVMYYTSNGGTSWAAKNRVFVGECITGAAAVSSAVAYALNGHYESASFSIEDGTDYVKSHNIGVDGGHVFPRLYLRKSEQFPWIQSYGVAYNGTARIGASVTNGGKGGKAKSDRLEVTIHTEAIILHANNYPYSLATESGSNDAAQAHLIVSRSF